ncbi:MAG: substrate-binding domain-containing protein [Suipraeoptans sp.]
MGEMMRKLSRNNMISVFILFIIISVVGIFIIKAYNSDANSNKSYNLILIPKAVDESNGFWPALIEGARLGSEEYGANLEVMGAATEEDVDGQIESVKKAIALEPDAILIAASDVTRITPSLKEAVEAGIEVVLVDSLIDDDSIGSCVVATDNVLAGKELGEYTKRLLDEDSQVAMVGHVHGTSTATEREKGMREGLGEFEKNVVEVVYAGSSYDRAYESTIKLLEKYPELDVIMGMNEYSSVGIARAIDELELSKKVKVVGFDNSLEEIQLLEKGVFEAIIIQKTVNMGYLGVEQTIRVLNGEKVEAYTDSGCKLITRGNMYIDENQRLLYPFSAGQQ